MNNIMLDIETLGKRNTPVVLAIGAVQFDIETGEIGETFEVIIDQETCLEYGFTTDADTIDWWSKQSPEARRILDEDTPKEDIGTALKLFADFYNKCVESVDKDYCYVWGNGVTFDNVIMEMAYHRMGIKKPWPYFADCDCRTLTMVTKGVVDRKSFKFVGVEHDAVDDCKHQVKWISAMHKAIKEGLRE